jgi:hypothetical protein
MPAFAIVVLPPPGQIVTDVILLMTEIPAVQDTASEVSWFILNLEKLRMKLDG